MDTSKETSDASFAELKLLVSNWYDKHISINMLKVLYRDHVKDIFTLHESSKTIQLIDLLIGSGNLSPNNLTLLYDTIKATEQFGLEQEIHTKMPSFKISKSIRDSVITKFTPHRQRLVKLGMALTASDVQNISELYKKKHTDRWSLIMDLEHSMVICEENMTAFIEKLKKHELYEAVKALTEDIPKPSSNSLHTSDIQNAFSNSGHRCGEDIQLTLTQRKRKKRESDDEDGSNEVDPLDLVNQLTKNKGNMKIKDAEEISSKLEKLNDYFKKICIKLNGIENGSIVFHLSVYDPNALMNLWEINISGKLIKDLAQILAQEKQQEFLDEWMTCIDENEYKSALTKLQENGQCSSMFSIISDDIDWEIELIKDLNRIRPELKFTIMKKWQVTKPQTIDHLIGESRKIIIAFSARPLMDYSKYAAHSVVIEMLEAKTLDDAKIIPVKISEDAIVPSEFESFTLLNFVEEKFIDKLLENCGADSKSVVFHLSVSDANALENLRDIHLSGDLIQELAGVLVPVDQQEVFVERWSSGLDEKQYQAALSRLKAKGGSYHLCIVSDDIEWETKLMEDLQHKRPELKCTILKKWKPETINSVVIESRRIIIAFSPKPLMEYSKYAAHSVVIEMLKAETLNDAKIIPVKVSEDAVVPIEFESFTLVNGYEENFVDKVLEDLDECAIMETQKSDMPHVSSIKTFKGSSEKLSSDEIKTQLEETSENEVHDFYVISDDAEWEQKIITELKKRRQGIRCISRSDWIPGKSKLLNLIEPVKICKKVVVGFSPSPGSTSTHYLAEVLFQKMLVDNNFGKLIPVKISKDSMIPEGLNMLTSANGWEDNIYELLLCALHEEKSQATYVHHT
ncbi:uncharacterized protein LOC117103804 isoform X2 [Anneissia japonica]|uniref:uncharacterized protein LOC117103804 isoform X2 n=1 Tax=Anneissia japonica TaxID=1529436 RepID=UPI0014258D66|nr:uncharacterized protein LOC117103804 isoform X2 [Anneissia japonica]